MAIRWPWQRTQRRSGVSISDPYVAQMLGWAGGDMPVVSEHLALNLSSVFRAVSLVAGSIATLPLRTYVTDSVTGLRAPGGSFLDNPAPVVNGRAMWQPASWKELCMVHQLLHGNMYLKHIYNNAGALSGLYPVHPLAVGVRWDYDGVVPGGRIYDVTLINGKYEVLDASNLTHVMGLSLDGLKGVSPLHAARVSLSGSLAGDKAAAKQFTRGPLIAGLLTPDEDMDPDDAEKAKKLVVNAMSGPENAGDVVMLNRKITFTPWQMTAADAQFLESREFQIEEVGRWFGIPPHLLGVTEKATSWGQGITEQNRGYARYTLRKHTTPFQESLTALIPSGKSAEFDYTAFEASSPEQRSTMLIAEVTGQVRTPNEARAELNLPPIDGGDVLRSPVKEATTPAAPLPEVSVPTTTTPGGSA